MNEDDFKKLYKETLDVYQTRARWQFSKRRASSRQFNREYMAEKLYKAISQGQPPQPPPPAPLPTNPNAKQNSHKSTNEPHTNYAGTSAIAQEAAQVCGCKACLAGKAHS